MISAAALAGFALPAVAPGKIVTQPKAAQPKTANLDGDPALEQVIPQKSAYGRRIVVQDTCNGAPYTRAISSEQEAVIRLTVANFEDITPRAEIFFDMRSGAGGRFGEIRVVSWEDGATPGACPQPRTLFRYPSKRTLGRVPRGAASHDTFDATLRDVAKRYAGKEVRLRETYVDRNDALCCPSFERISWFGYRAGRDQYVRFRTHVKRIRK